MPAPISVIIPTLNAAPVIAPALDALMPGLRAGLVHELIIADGGSSDDIAGIAGDIGARLVVTGPGRGMQLAAGAAAAGGKWLLFLHADSVLPANWPAAVEAHLRSHPGEAGYFRLAFDDSGLPARVLAGWANLRSRLFSLPFGDQGLLVSQALYREAGGYPVIPLMEDVAIARALGGRVRMLSATVTTSARRYRKDGWLRRSWLNFTTLALFLASRDAETLVRRYRR
ncbi:MAG: TIGR04283 family arsenosugar biosynthesis glycosyltransferase [Paracoccaceae bacterium]